ncbi:MAG: HD domain-containing protein [Acidobacteria bacterium]|nr:HD domain-containing protein [Thermoanaerobaculia bacterium]MDI9632035.1 HD domain-containing protein [Acidobacteriota bacterium]MBP7813037.1 HD domain-containing protein [Thermoanaerobaculia bacterium]NLN10322.1 HD domain-containing protein [Acidobacteriota bacterium]HPA94805.1 HD domain-containing protein [Thermoanaerobaculia bacterium]
MTTDHPLSLRDPVHGFVRADRLEAALIDSRPVQRLRSIHQLGLMSLVFPGAEHSRFGHVLGAMELAGQAFDALAARAPAPLRARLGPRERRLVRAAALLHDIGHAPYSHSAEGLFEEGIDHEEMTRRLIAGEEIAAIFARHGEGIEGAEVAALLAGRPAGPRLLFQIVAGELDVDKMDYLLRDSLFCGVRYGNYDLPRLLDTLLPVADPETGEWGIGVDEGGVHAVEALVLARYYMFTQVYFNVTAKALELHLSEWLRREGHRWPATAERFLAEDDLTVLARLRASRDPHARALTERRRYPLAFETREHLSKEEKNRFEELLPELARTFPAEDLLISNSAKDPHKLGPGRVWVRRRDGSLEPMAEASHFIRFLTRIERYRIYARPEVAPAVGGFLAARWPDGVDRGRRE